MALRGSRLEVFTVSPGPYEAWLLEPKFRTLTPEDITVPSPRSQVLKAPRTLPGTRDSDIQSQAGAQTGGACSAGSGIAMLADP